MGKRDLNRSRRSGNNTYTVRNAPVRGEREVGMARDEAEALFKKHLKNERMRYQSSA
jgi:hypothetical protein